MKPADGASDRLTPRSPANDLICIGRYTERQRTEVGRRRSPSPKGRPGSLGRFFFACGHSAD
jgi:hypothetical protein